MDSLTEMYKVGKGPSSSHTVGPYRVIKKYIEYYPTIARMEVTLFGSLSLTGKGHHTDRAMMSAAEDKKVKVEVIWDYIHTPEHPNTLEVQGFDAKGNKLPVMRAHSVGGGSIEIIDDPHPVDINVYPHNNFKEIRQWCTKKNLTLVDYVKEFDPIGWQWLPKVWETMVKSVENGIPNNDNFRGEVQITKKAKIILDNLNNRKEYPESHLYAMAYAYAVSELNVMGGDVVTAPTLGSAGIIPAVFYYAWKNRHIPLEKIYEALAIAGIVGNCFKHNGSIAGATGGCQAEVGVACSMAAAGYCHLLGGNLKEIEASSIIAMEHHLGMTCDPILGYVYSPCIERNGAVCMHAISSAEQSILTNGLHDIFDLDDIVAVELQTGKDMKEEYRETGLGGLAKRYNEKYPKGR